MKGQSIDETFGDLSTWADPVGVVPLSEKEKVLLIYELLNYIKRLKTLLGPDEQTCFDINHYLEKLEN